MRRFHEDVSKSGASARSRRSATATIGCPGTATLARVVYLCLFLLVSSHVDAATTWIQTLDFPGVVVRFKVLASGSVDVATPTFTLRENDAEVVSVSASRRSPQQSLIFLVDRSSSIGPAVDEIKRSAARFLTSLPKDARIAVLSFASDVEINQFFTNDRRKLVNSLRGIRHWGGTALYDAMHMACELLYTDSDPEDLRTLVLFTDGKDETPALRTRMSIRSLEEVLAMAHRHKVRVMAVGMGDEIDKQILQKVANETDGWFLFAPTAKELASLYAKISARLQAERHFQIRFNSPNPTRDGTARKVVIHCGPDLGSQQIPFLYDAPGPAGSAGKQGLSDQDPAAATAASSTRSLPKFQPWILEASSKGENDPRRHEPIEPRSAAGGGTVAPPVVPPSSPGGLDIGVPDLGDPDVGADKTIPGPDQATVTTPVAAPATTLDMPAGSDSGGGETEP